MSRHSASHRLLPLARKAPEKVIVPRNEPVRGLFDALVRGAWEKRWGIGEGLLVGRLGVEVCPEKRGGLRQAAGSIRFAYLSSFSR